MPSLLRAAFAALCALLFMSPGAGAAAPIVLDSSADAYMAAAVVDASGTAHVAWNVKRDVGVGDQIKYCRVPRNFTGCAAAPRVFTPDDRQAPRPPSIFFRGAGLVIASGRTGTTDTTWVTTTASLGGAGFDGGRVAGNIYTARSILGPGENLMTSIRPAPSALGETRIQVASLISGTETNYAVFPANGISFDTTFRPGLALYGSAVPMFSYQDDEGTWLRRYDPTKPNTVAGFHNAANWIPEPVKVAGERDSTLAFDPSAGAYLLTRFSPNGDSDRAFQTRAVSETNGSLAAPQLATDVGPPGDATFTVNAEGRRTVVWNTTSDGGPLKAATAGVGGGFSLPSTLVPSVSAYHLAVATTADGGGLAVWDGNHAGGVSAVAIPVGGPVPDPTPTPPPGAAPVPPTPTPDVSDTCKLTLAPGVVARARGGNGVSGCWVNKPGTKQYSYDGTVDVNGVIITATGAKGTGVKVDLAKRTLTAPKGVQTKAGTLVLGSGAIEWQFSTTSGLASRYAQPAFTSLEKAVPGGKGINLLGFDVVGDASLAFGNGDAYVTPWLSMPFPFDGLTAAATIRVTPAGGLIIDGVEFEIENATIGPVQIRKLRVRAANGGGDFIGEAEALLPATGQEIAVVVRFSNGDLVQLAAQVTGLNVPLGPVVTLNGVGFDYVNDANKYGFAGGADLAFPSATGPFWLNALPNPGNGTGGFRIEVNKAKKTAIVRFDGQFQFGAAAMDSRFTFGRFGLGLNTETKLLAGFVNVGLGNDTIGIRGAVNGAVNYQKGAFFFDGRITACLLGCVDLVEVYAGGSKTLEGGIGGCVRIPLLVTDVELSVGYKWKTGPDAGLTCNQEAYKPAAFKNPGAPEPAAPEPKPLVVGTDVTKLPEHPLAKDVALALGGNKDAEARAKENVVWSAEVKGPKGGGAPQLKVTQVVTTTEEQGNLIYVKEQPAAATDRVILQSNPTDPNAPVGVQDAVLVPNPSTDSTRLVFVQRGIDSLKKLPANISQRMRITRLDGSPINFALRRPGVAHRLQAGATGISFARNFDDATVRGTLGGKARKRTIRWSAANLAAAGRTIEFVEADASGTLKSIKTTKAASGSASWTIADGPGGRRIVRAQIRNFEGAVVDRRDVGNFIAPPTPKPAKATRLKLRLGKGGKLAASWAGPKNAATTLVEVTVADGRGYQLRTRKRSVSIPGVGAKERVTVKVTGLSKSGVRGPSASVRR